MIGYTKLFQTLVTSSIWSEDDKTRIVWITMLALKNRDGVVESSKSGLATMSHVTMEDCQKALDKLMAPDTDSRTTAHEGRRIERVEGGWLVLNHELYREKMSLEERRAYNRDKMRQHRAKAKELRQGQTIAEIVTEKLDAEDALAAIE